MQPIRTKTTSRAAETKPAAARPAQRRENAPQRPVVQCAPKVSSPHDPAEKEADATAKKIMRMPDRPAPVSSSVESPYIRRFASSGIFPKEKKKEDDKILRAADGQPRAIPKVADEIRAAGEGTPLPRSVRAFMEPRFRADFGSVRIHTGDRAAKLNRDLNARAFTYGNQLFFGRDRFRPDTADGKELIAHELTHTLQQGAAIRRSSEPVATQATETMIQCWGIGNPLDLIADAANVIPGFRMFTIVLGMNPITMSPVERTPANLMRAAVEFMPFGALIVRGLDSYGIFDKVGAWVVQKVGMLRLTASAFRAALDEFLRTLKPTDIFSPGDVVLRALRIFSVPVNSLIGFIRGTAQEIVGMIREAILKPLARLARGTRGYDLIRAILGEDPISGEAVPRTAETLIGGFLKLIGEEELWNNLKKANALPRAWAWFQLALAGVQATVRAIPGLFRQALNELRVTDLIELPQAFARVVGIFTTFIHGTILWAQGTVWTLLEIIFDVVAPGIPPYLKKAGGAFRSILRNPLGFASNLVRAGILGLRQFAANIFGHLQASLVKWLTGTLEGAGIYIPKSFELRELITFVLSVLGVTWGQIRQKLVKVVGEPAVKALETGFDIVVALVTKGPAAAWEKIKEAVANLKEMVIGEIMSFVTSRIVESAIQKLVSMINPVVGGIIQLVSGIWNTIMFFRERMRQIIQVATAVIDSIAAIASGALGAAANRVETTLAGVLTLAISFLARILGLGKISDAVINVITRVRSAVERAIDKVIEWIVTMAKKGGRFLLQAARRGATAAGSAAKAAAKKVVSWWRAAATFSAGGESHRLFFRGASRSARLTVASTPRPVEEFLAAKAAEYAKNAERTAAVAAARQKLQAIDAVIGTVKEDEQDEKLQKRVETLMNELAGFLVPLLSETEWGTEQNPAPLDYEKRRAAAYPVFYLAGAEFKGWSQKDLKKKFDEGKSRTKIIRCTPTGSVKTPGGEETLGLAAGSVVDVGKRFLFTEKGVRGSKVADFKKLMALYCFVPSENGFDVDHVIELQIGGRDAFNNLWPLPSGENRSSGAIIKAAKTKIPGHGEIPVALAHEKKRTGNKPLWLMITSTRQR